IKDLSAWFVVARSGEAVALRKIGNQWARVPMPKMDPVVPERFGKDTYMLLRPAAFGDLVKIGLPKFQMFYDAGGNRLEGRQLWTILKRASERRIRLRLVSLDPNGLGVESVITAGVTISPGGQWIDPPIKPSARR